MAAGQNALSYPIFLDQFQEKACDSSYCLFYFVLLELAMVKEALIR